MRAVATTNSQPTAGFSPITAENARVLILGSLPSTQSVQKHQYYGNPQNAFWRIMGSLFDATPDKPYALRTKILAENRVAVWDVLQSSVRPGSLDANINLDSAVANDFAEFFATHSRLKFVAFNGKKAAQLYSNLVVKPVRKNHGKIQYTTLPSTSPAHAAMSFADKLSAWSVIRQIANSSHQ